MRKKIKKGAVWMCQLQKRRVCVRYNAREGGGGDVDGRECKERRGTGGRQSKYV